MPEYNAKRIIKIYKGDTQVWEDTDTWVQLKLGTGVTGCVLFKSNGDGTAQLAGAINITGFTQMNFLAVYPPEGYQFTSINWTKPIMAKPVYNGSYGSNDAGTVEVKDGNLYCGAVSAVASQNGVMYFANNRMNSSFSKTNAGDSVQINIKSI